LVEPDVTTQAFRPKAEGYEISRLLRCFIDP
jgi:hypothetical protein